MTVRPYADSAPTYHQRGWAPLPLPPRAKKAPPTGWTGYLAPYPSYADVHAWAMNGVGGNNIALRMSPDVLGIDLDAYKGKRGRQTMDEAIDRLGPLPDTAISTSRDLPSGIRFYRVPEGRRWADVLGPDVEIIHHGHRYAVVAPSIHPETGDAYRWLAPDGSVVPGPAVSDLPLLPVAWVEYLDRGSVDDVSPKANVNSEEVNSWLEALPVGGSCTYLPGVLSTAADELAQSTSRHDTVRGYVARIVRAGEQGHHDALACLDTLEGLWLSALARGHDRDPDYGEWARMVAGAVAIVVASPTPDADKGCCGHREATGGMILSAVDDTDFWQARPVLAHIHTYARSRMTSPWAVLGVVLTRCVASVPPSVTLPPIVGSRASLNLYVALVGPSGAGKGAAERVAGECIDFGDPVNVVTIGSGEGIPHLFAYRDRHKVVIRKAVSVLFSVPEVDNLTALAQRQGATLLPQLRSAWSGEKLGFAYADPAKSLPIEADTYRLCLVLGVQPARAKGLLDDAGGGTPQRFAFLPSTDPEAPDELPETPEQWEWDFPGPWPRVILGRSEDMDVCQVARDTIVNNRRAQLRGSTDALDGHSLLTRLKVAAALALLDGQRGVRESDWELASIVMAVSDETRGQVQSVLAAEGVAASEHAAKREARKAVVIDETRERAQLRRVAQGIKRRLTDNGWQSLNSIRHAIAGRDRDLFEDALAALLEVGEVEASKDDAKPRYRVVSE